MGGEEVDISQPQQEPCDDRGQAMSHTRDSGGSPYHAERASLNTPLLSLPISLCLCSLTKTTHYCGGQTHSLSVQNTSSMAVEPLHMSVHKHRQRSKKMSQLHI